MNATGTKITTSDSVVAITARPISAVASAAASFGVTPFSSTNRKMFSSTTIASSMTMPVASDSASIVMLFSVKPNDLHEREGADDRGRDRQRGDERDAQVADEQEHDDAGEQAAEDQVQLDVLERAADEARLVVADADLDVRRQRAPGSARSRSMHAVDDFDGVGARLLADLHADRRRAARAASRCGSPARVSCTRPTSRERDDRAVAR